MTRYNWRIREKIGGYCLRFYKMMVIIIDEVPLFSELVSLCVSSRFCLYSLPLKTTWYKANKTKYISFYETFFEKPKTRDPLREQKTKEDNQEQVSNNPFIFVPADRTCRGVLVKTYHFIERFHESGSFGCCRLLSAPFAPFRGRKFSLGMRRRCTDVHFVVSIKNTVTYR